ncbi:MAG: replicative DNA helicase, partial [Lachnospiraceae bacterium]|nr:replicative DNA helicase [Lachnospiraceae bacterium]
MEETVSRKGMPHNLDAERSVIGSMLLDKEAIGLVTGVITREDFYDETLGIYFEVLVEMNQQGLETDEVTVQERMRARHVPEAQCSTEYMLDLMNSVPSSVNTMDYAAIVRDKSRLRRFIRISDKLAGDCYKDDEPVEDVFGRAEEQMFRLFQEGQAAETMPISRIVVEALNNIEKAAKSGGQTTGIPTGFYDLDYRTAGLQPSDLILIAARPSMGKTAFALNLAENIAVRKHVPTAIFSLEMSQVQLVNRILSLDSGVNLQKIRTGKLEDHDWEDMMIAARRVGEAPLYIFDTPA